MTPNTRRALMTLAQKKALTANQFEGQCLSRLQYEGWVQLTQRGSNNGLVRKARFELTAAGWRVVRQLQREVRT